ncbi:MAG: hypothetical protein ACMVO3_11655 [Thalassobaculum sp.]
MPTPTRRYRSSISAWWSSARRRSRHSRRSSSSDAAPTPRASVPVYFDGATHTAAVYARGDLMAGQRFEGPAIVTQDDCTTCVLGGFTATVDPSGNLILSRED